MKYRHGLVAALLLISAVAITSSTLQARTGIHIAWDGMVVGKNGSTIKGLVSMEAGDRDGTTTVEISFKGDAPRAVRPWHIHRGSCAKSGPVFGPASAYAMLTANAKGESEGKATLAVTVPDTGYFYVNVHESTTRMSNIIACGDLLLED